MIRNADSQKPRRAQADRRAETRARLLDAARALFLEDGYEATTTRAILDRAGLSKGAMYHHFTSKVEIMEAIYDAEAAVALRGAARDGETPLAALRASALAWLAEIRKPETGRILLQLGPAALGAPRVKEIEERRAIALLTDALAQAKAAGEARIDRPDIAARLLSALLAEAALLHLEAEGDADAEAEALINRFFEALR